MVEQKTIEKSNWNPDFEKVQKNKLHLILEKERRKTKPKRTLITLKPKSAEARRFFQNIEGVYLVEIPAGSSWFRQSTARTDVLCPLSDIPLHISLVDSNSGNQEDFLLAKKFGTVYHEYLIPKGIYQKIINPSSFYPVSYILITDYPLLLPAQQQKISPDYHPCYIKLTKPRVSFGSVHIVDLTIDLPEIRNFFGKIAEPYLMEVDNQGYAGRHIHDLKMELFCPLEPLPLSLYLRHQDLNQEEKLIIANKKEPTYEMFLVPPKVGHFIESQCLKPISYLVLPNIGEKEAINRGDIKDFQVGPF